MIVEAQVVLPYITHLPEDVVVNTFHFNIPGTDLAPLGDIGPLLIAHYNDTVDGPDVSLGQLLTAYIDRTTNSCEIRFYDAQAEGGPLGVGPFTLDATAQLSSLPFEVALCGSISGYQPGGNPRRERGRVYYGPFNSNVLSDPDNVPAVPTAALVNTIVGTQARLAEDVDALGADIFWGVYSRVDDAIYRVSAGWVDNAWDTQRRREVPASSRTAWNPI